jgi:hypothetical protein
LPAPALALPAGFVCADCDPGWLPGVTSSAAGCVARYRNAGAIVPAVSPALGGKSPVDTATTTAAAAMPPPIQILRLPARLFFPAFMSVPLEDAHCWKTCRTLSPLPGLLPRVSFKLATITPGAPNSWPKRPGRVEFCGIFAKTEAIRPSGGNACRTRLRPSKRHRNSSYCARAMASLSRRRSSSPACAGVASPSRTTCISSTSWDWLMFFSPAESLSTGRAGGGGLRKGGI